MRFHRFFASLSLAILQSSMALPARNARGEGEPLMAITTLSMESTFLLWADTYRVNGQSINLNVEPMVGAQVARKFSEGAALIAGMNRDLKPEEVNAFVARWGYPPTRITVGLNALVLLAHKSNPLKEIKLEQVDAVWSATRLQGWPKDIETWGDLGLAGAWAGRSIARVGRPEGAGLRDYFTHSVLMDGKVKPDTRHGEDGMAMYKAVLADPAAMGYGDLSEVYAGVRALPIVPKGGGKAVDPTPANVANGSYPLTRALYIYVNKAPGKALDPGLAGFLRFVLSPEGQEQVRLNGMVALPEDLVRGNLRRLAQ